MSKDIPRSAMGKIGFQVFQRQEVFAILQEILLEPRLDDLKRSDRVLAGIHKRSQKAGVDFVELLNHLINHDDFEMSELQEIIQILPQSLQNLDAILRIDAFKQYLNSL